MATIDLSKTSYSSSIIIASGVTLLKGSKLSTLSGKNTTGDSDTITGGNGQDYVEAGAGNDIISGGNGKDTIYSGEGNDTIWGDSNKSLDTIEDNAKDTLYGGSGKDKMYGGNGADVLYGDEKNTGSGDVITESNDADDAVLAGYNDFIDGGNGPDQIIGGLGGDLLSGGSGPDIFVYNSIADSRSTGGDAGPLNTDADDWDGTSGTIDGFLTGTGDYITDFIKGQDKLDFTNLNLGNAALHFSGTTAEVNGIWYLIEGGFTYIFADTNGTGGADIAIKVAGAIDFSKSDFIGINDAPTSTDDSVTTLEDTAVVLGINDFGNFSDVDGDLIAAVKITTLESNGSLEFYDGANWVAVTLNQEISAADIAGGNLRFVPDLNENGNNYATIGFKVGDGTDFSVNAYNLTVNVTSVNDAPAGTDNTLTILEDGSHTFTAADFGFTDAADGNSLLAVTITTLPLAGTLQLSGVDVTLGQSITAANIGNLVYTPVADANGTGYASFTFQVQDDGGTADGGVDLDQSANTMTIDVTSVNDAPSGTDNTLTILEDGSHTFTAADFGFTDTADSNSLLAVKITTVPLVGTLQLNGANVDAGDFISVADIGNLVYTPVADANGAGYASFTFQVQDDGGTADGGVDLDQSANIMTIDVTAVNDAPLIFVDGAVSYTSNTPAIAIDTSITITDIDSSTLAGASIVISSNFAAGDTLNFTNQLGIIGSYNSATGVLTLTGSASLADYETAIESITFSTTSSSATTRTLSYTVTDGTATSAIDTATVSVTVASDPNDFGDENHDDMVLATAQSGTNASETLKGTVNNDSINGSNGDDIIYGGAGIDTLNGNNDNDTIYGGSGNDSINGNGGNDTIYGGSGVDTIAGDTNNDTIYGGSGDDIIDGGGGLDLLYGGAGNDTITGDTDSDTIYGGSGNDIINGGGGNASDLIIGGYGLDTLTGANGSDTFKYLSLEDGGDTIVDFNTGAPASGGDVLDISDVLDVSGSTWNDGDTVADAIANGYISFTDNGGHIQVNVDIDGSAGATYSATSVAVLTNTTFTTSLAAGLLLQDNIIVD